MAANPTFLSQYKTNITGTGNIVFQPTKNSRIYNAYCRNSSGAGTAKIEIGTPNAGAPDVLTANVDVSLRYEFFNTGTDAVQYSSAGSGYDNKWFETIKVGGTVNFESIDIELEGTYPLVNETTVQYQLVIPGNNIEQRSQTFAATTTAQEVADAIIFDLISRREVGFFNGTSHTATTLSLPEIQYISTIGISQPTSTVNTLSLSVNKVGSMRPSTGASAGTILSSLFTKSNTGLLFSYTYITSTVDGQTVPSTSLATFSITPSVATQVGQPAGTRFVPNPNAGYGVASGVWAISPSFSDYNGEVGTETDPFVLNSDLKSKLLTLFQNGSVLTGSANQQSFTLTANEFVTSEVVASLPTLVSTSFVGAGESKELIDDETINPLLITDVHGNKFFPVQAGQRIVISAPEAESVILVYGEE